MLSNINDYYNAPKLKYPISNENRILTSIVVRCSECNRKTHSQRGYIRDRRRRKEIVGASVCLKCKLITPFCYYLKNNGQLTDKTNRISIFA